MFITDLPEVCELIGVNIELNQQTNYRAPNHHHDLPSANSSREPPILQAVPIGWSDPAPPIPEPLLTSDDIDLTASSASTPFSGRCLDIDTIVLSDVVYDPELYVPLVSTLASLAPPPSSPPTHARSDGSTNETVLPLKSKNNKSVDIVLAHRHRNPMDPQFWAALKCAGFAIDKVNH
jgi:hypothetical protein